MGFVFGWLSYCDDECVHVVRRGVRWCAALRRAGRCVWQRISITTGFGWLGALSLRTLPSALPVSQNAVFG